MANYEADAGTLDGVFHALADPTRRAVLRRLTRGPASVGALQTDAAAGISAPALSKHLRVLEGAGLLRQERRGRVRLCRLDPGALEEAEAWLDEMRQFWTTRLDELVAFIEEQREEETDDDGVAR